MALAYLTINLDAFTGDDHPPVPSYSTITLDPGVDHIDAAADVIHVRTIVVSLDRQGKAATANGVPCVDGEVPVVAGVAYAVSAPNVLRGGPHYIPALTAGQVVALSDYITPGAPLTPDQAAALAARVTALEAIPPGVTDHGALTGLGGDDHTQYALADGTRGSFAAPLGADDNYVTDAEKAALHAHGNKAALDLVSGTNTGDQVLPTWSTISGKPAVVAEGATQAAARTAIGAGTSSFSGAYADLSGKPTTMTPTAHTHDIADLTATGTPSATTYLRGDGTWAAPAGPLTGTGFPEGVIAASVGTEYVDTSGTNGAVKWLKTSGTGTTGWKVTYGDTGWRNMQAEFESICTANSLTFSVTPGFLSPRIRRVGDLLLLDVGVNITGTGANTIDFQSAFGQNLNGFRGGPNNRAIPASVTGSAGVIHWAPYYYVKFWSPGLQTLNVVWPITDTAPWPTSLPGTPA